MLSLCTHRHATTAVVSHKCWMPLHLHTRILGTLRLYSIMVQWVLFLWSSFIWPWHRRAGSDALTFSLSLKDRLCFPLPVTADSARLQKRKEKEKKTLSVILIQQSQSQCNQWEYAINEQSLQSIARCVLIHLVHRLLILPLTPPPPTMSFHSSTVLFC